MNAPAHFRAQIDADTERAWLELKLDQLHGLIEELDEGYGPNKTNIPDLVDAALRHADQMARELKNRINSLDTGENA